MADERVLLINPPYTKATYVDIDRRAGALQNPLLSLSTIGKPLTQNGCAVKLLDMDLHVNHCSLLKTELQVFKPRYVGVTGTTPLFPGMARVCRLIKTVSPETLVIVGGPHVTVLPEEALNQAGADVAVLGEGDFTLYEIMSSDDLDDVPGICYKRDGEMVFTSRREAISNLDDLPFPAWELYEIEKYKTSKLVERRGPTGLIETSRGCVHRCVYCNKATFGTKFRTKSPSRVVDEMEMMLDLGFREIHIADDGFSTDLRHAKGVCDEIVKRRLRFPWMLINGIRADMIDEELMRKLKQAGCYEVAFGIDAGNQDILDRVGKRMTLDDIRNAVRLAKGAKLETFGFFILGLPDETEATLQDTIDLACELDLDLAKFAIAVPFPGTALHQEWNEKGCIIEKDWSKYLLHNLSMPLYRHPNLEWETLVRYYKKAYREFYFRPKFLARRLYKSIVGAKVLYDLSYLAQTKWL